MADRPVEFGDGRHQDDGARSRTQSNPDDLELVVRGNVRVTPEPLEERGSFVGSWDQILADIKATELAGADELFIEPQGDSPEEFISLMEQVRAAVG